MIEIEYLNLKQAEEAYVDAFWRMISFHLYQKDFSFLPPLRIGEWVFSEFRFLWE